MKIAICTRCKSEFAWRPAPGREAPDQCRACPLEVRALLLRQERDNVLIKARARALSRDLMVARLKLKLR